MNEIDELIKDILKHNIKSCEIGNEYDHNRFILVYEKGKHKLEIEMIEDSRSIFFKTFLFNISIDGNNHNPSKKLKSYLKRIRKNILEKDKMNKEEKMEEKKNKIVRILKKLNKR